MKFGLFMVAMSVVVCDGRGRSRSVSRNIGASSRRMLLSRSSKSRSRTRISDGTSKVVMSDVDWRVCLFGLFVGVCFMYVIW
jgi:hypothetical protein